MRRANGQRRTAEAVGSARIRFESALERHEWVTISRFVGGWMREMTEVDRAGRCQCDNDERRTGDGLTQHAGWSPVSQPEQPRAPLSSEAGAAACLCHIVVFECTDTVEQPQLIPRRFWHLAGLLGTRGSTKSGNQSLDRDEQGRGSWTLEYIRGQAKGRRVDGWRVASVRSGVYSVASVVCARPSAPACVKLRARYLGVLCLSFRLQPLTPLNSSVPTLDLVPVGPDPSSSRDLHPHTARWSLIFFLLALLSSFRSTRSFTLNRQIPGEFVALALFLALIFVVFVCAPENACFPSRERERDTRPPPAILAPLTLISTQAAQRTSGPRRRSSLPSNFTNRTDSALPPS
ncbi:hypothetical protein CMUS01_02119 [Colletotrichum musicola]|uniref:Uncharacterized protein n=1 Tax=Colletotrichum musicola TaxID=2175873 RepID=A0A8H6NVY5_9PEZI|nr:hypothetical protein CMUS01_02119 [Colletotrichum musicola]